MKKIVTVVTLMLAFTISANAQDKKNLQEKKADKKEVIVLSPVEAAKKDAAAIVEFLGLKESQEQDFVRLFEMKHQLMQDSEVSIERKKEMSIIVSHKIFASIENDQQVKLHSNPELLKKLTE
jgi:hypothetical protein